MAAVELEDRISEAVQVSLASLDPEDRDNLSKVLFPDTHTETVQLCGQARTLRPCSIKVSRQLNHLLQPLVHKLDDDSQAGEDDLRLDEDLLKALFAITNCLAAFYEWPDVLKQVQDEDVAQIEMEALAFTQQRLNGANDFLLQPLRVLVKMLQARELAVVTTESLRRLVISLPSSIAGTAASMT